MKRRKYFVSKMELIRCFAPLRFLWVSVGVAAVCLLSCADIIQSAIRYPDYQGFSSIYEIEKLLTFDRYKPVLIAILCMLCSREYVKDQSEHYLRMILTRTSLKNYLYSKVLVNMCATVMACITGFFLTVIFLLPVMQPFPEGIYLYADFFDEMELSQFQAFGFLILLGLKFGLAASIMSMVGMWISVYQPQSYVAIGSAVIFFYFFYSISLVLPQYLSFDVISSRFIQIEFPSVGTMIAYHFIYLIIFYLLTSAGFIKAVQRRWKNGSLL